MALLGCLVGFVSIDCIELSVFLYVSWALTHFKDHFTIKALFFALLVQLLPFTEVNGKCMCVLKSVNTANTSFLTFAYLSVHFAYIFEATHLDAKIDQFYPRQHHGYCFHGKKLTAFTSCD